MAPPFKTVVKNHKVTSDNLSQAWKSTSLPARQWRLVEPQLVDFEKGLPCQEFLIFLKAIDACCAAMANSPQSLLEIGCSRGYYGHVLKSQCPDIKYTGVDYSESFINFGKLKFPDFDLRVGDTTNLIFKNQEFEIAVSGCVLLHVYDWKLGVQESCRVANNFVIFHRTPVTESATTLLKKRGYLKKMVEWAFNEQEFISTVNSSGFKHLQSLTIHDDIKLGTNPKKPVLITYIFQRT